MIWLPQEKTKDEFEISAIAAVGATEKLLDFLGQYLKFWAL